LSARLSGNSVDGEQCCSSTASRSRRLAVHGGGEPPEGRVAQPLDVEAVARVKPAAGVLHQERRILEPLTHGPDPEDDLPEPVEEFPEQAALDRRGQVAVRRRGDPDVDCTLRMRPTGRTGPAPRNRRRSAAWASRGARRVRRGIPSRRVPRGAGRRGARPSRRVPRARGRKSSPGRSSRPKAPQPQSAPPHDAPAGESRPRKCHQPSIVDCETPRECECLEWLQRDSNPCFSPDRAVSWVSRDDRRAGTDPSGALP
jgi:hypothetical protein